MKTKVCSKCKKEKSINLFSKNKSKKEGYNAWCKSCRQEYMINYCQNNKEKIKEYKTIYRKEHKEIINEWYEKNPWYSHYNSAKQRCNNPKKEHYEYYGGRGIKFLMTSEDFKYLWNRDEAYLMEQPSIDRKDNDGDYTPENCQFLELVENLKKRHNSL